MKTPARSRAVHSAFVAFGMTVSSIVSADVVRHDNADGGFSWVIHDLFESQTLTQALDPTAAAAQGGAPVDHGVSYGAYIAPPEFIMDALIGQVGMRLAMDAMDWAPVPYNLLLRIPHLYAPGESVGPGPIFIPEPERLTLGFWDPGIVAAFVADQSLEEYHVQDDLILYANGESFIGLEFDLPDGVHYGWIHVRAVFNADGTLNRYDPMAWAYETTPGLPILIDEPAFCPTDISGDRFTGIEEFLAVLASWGQGGPTDFDFDGTTGIQDFLRVLSSWGACP